jgi:putative ABC transport system permease protein
VVGVLPEHATTPLNADVYTALHPSRQGEGMGTNFECITRLRDGVTWHEADAQINRAWLNRPHRYELGNNPNAQVSYYSVPLQQRQAATLRPQALALMLSAGFILLIACANLGGLTLVRVLRRTPEIATRMALGASRWQIQKQVWIENLLLAVTGGIVGVAIGVVALNGLLLLLPEHFLPVNDLRLDIRVLAFTAVASLASTIFFGMFPALATRKLDLRSAMANRTSGSGERLTLRQALIAGEVALTVVLLDGAGLLVRTLIHLQTLQPGFSAQGVMTAKASLDNVRYHDVAAFRKLLDESTEAMRRIPGVEHAAVGLSVPYERTLNDAGITLAEGKNAGQQIVTGMAYVTPDYFSTLQIPLLSGRTFTDTDAPDKQLVAIVNQMFARKFFRGENPVGLHLDKDTLIIGVVADVAMAPAIDPTAPLSDEQMMYVPAAQMGGRMLLLTHIWFQPSWIVRTSHPVEGLTSQMQLALGTADPDLPFSGFYRMTDLLAKTLATQRVEVALLCTMAGLALLLSAVGIFGLVANLATQKTREIGIRIALGSTIREAMLQIGLPGLRASAVGLVCGLLLCGGGLRLMRSVLYGIGVDDAPTLVSALGILALIAFSAATVPTLRIARIDPAETLREE